MYNKLASNFEEILYPMLESLKSLSNRDNKQKLGKLDRKIKEINEQSHILSQNVLVGEMDSALHILEQNKLNIELENTKKERQILLDNADFTEEIKMLATNKKISIIPPKIQYDKNLKVEQKKLRVAAYCRVSTLLEQQESSYDAQVEYYTNKINTCPNWTCAGIFADEGKSATATAKRDDFNALITACMKGKIDLVLTKSVSRFARNTVDALQNIRLLKEKNIPVIFEKEGINTMESGGELLLTILSSQAQEESRNISESTRWGIARKFENGGVSVNHKKFMGYTKDDNGNLVIVPEEAEVVRRIFKEYLEGKSIGQIAKGLINDGIKTATGLEKWHVGTIEKMLSQEKYMGDALLQKTITLDFLTKKKVKNDGYAKQFYVENNHPAIIPRELFLEVQAEKARRASLNKSAVTRKQNKAKSTTKSKYSSKYILTDLLKCAECGHDYRRQVWSKYGQKSAVWRCEDRLKNGSKSSCKSAPTIKENELHSAIMSAINKIVDGNNEFVQVFRNNVLEVIEDYEGTKQSLDKLKPKIYEYDEKLVKSLIESIRISKNLSVEVRFYSGVVVTEKIEDNS